MNINDNLMFPRVIPTYNCTNLIKIITQSIVSKIEALKINFISYKDLGILLFEKNKNVLIYSSEGMKKLSSI